MRDDRFEKKCQEELRIADNIHNEFKNNYKRLKDICEKNNMVVDDYLYVMGYSSIREYLLDLESRV